MTTPWGVSMTKTLIIMPAWNEEEVIGDTITELLTVMPQCDLLVVNDGSTDSTVRVAEAAGARVLNLPYNMGVGGAMRAGFKYARRFDYDRAIQVDADGQHDPRDVRLVLDGLEHANISIGARFAGRGEYSVRGPRAWAMRFLSWIVSRWPTPHSVTSPVGFALPTARQSSNIVGISRWNISATRLIPW